MKKFLRFVGRSCAVACAAAVFMSDVSARGDDPCTPQLATFELPNLNSRIRTIASNGEFLYAGGLFTSAGEMTINYVARRDGGQWSPLGEGVNSWVTSLALVNGHGEGGGRALYAGGHFTTAGGSPAAYIAKWDETIEQWLTLGDGLDGHVTRLFSYTPPGAETSVLVVAGPFTRAGSLPAKGLAVWDGLAWSTIGDVEDGIVHAMAVHDHGDGPALYVGGAFRHIGGVEAMSLAKWTPDDGWSPVGPVNGTVRALLSFNDGSGPALYVGGSFKAAGGLAAAHIVRFGPGPHWWPLAEGLSHPVHELTVFGDGEFAHDKPVVWAGGMFQGGPSLFELKRGIARWDGTTWEFIGPNGWEGFFLSPSPWVHSFGFTSGGDGSLYAMGYDHRRWIGCPPVNDLRANARPLTEGTTAFHNFNATTQGPGETEYSDEIEPRADVWFTHKANCTGTLTVSLCGSAFPTTIAAYHMTVLDSSDPEQFAQPIANNAGSCPGGDGAKVSVTLLQGQSLLIRIGGVGGAQGAGVIRVQCSPLVGDLNGDGVVDVLDLLTLLAEWGPCPPVEEPCPADLTDDGVVDVLDLLILLTNWSSS